MCLVVPIPYFAIQVRRLYFSVAGIVITLVSYACILYPICELQDALGEAWALNSPLFLTLIERSGV